jgi:DNA-binding response OmpR family regulator
MATESTARPRIVRFGTFEADLTTRELRKSGVRIKLHGQPFEVLALLLERPGDVIPREELRQRL